MLIKKSVISKVKTVNNNVNKIYEDFIAIVSEKIEEKD